MDCKTPGQVSNIHADSVMNDFMQNLNIIIEAVGLGWGLFLTVIYQLIYFFVISLIHFYIFSPEKNTPEFDSPIVLDVLPQNMAKPTVKVVKKKLANDTMNTSICESVISRSTTRGKNNETIPKNINKKNKKGETALHTACRTVCYILHCPFACWVLKQFFIVYNCRIILIEWICCYKQAQILIQRIMLAGHHW